MLDKQMIIIICTFLERNCIDSFRQCNNYLNIVIGPSYFKNIEINAEKIDIKYKFRSFVHKYNLNLNIINIQHHHELFFFLSFKLNSLHFSKNKLYHEYFLSSKSLLHLTFSHYFNQEIKENILPQSLLYLTFGNYFNQKIKENVLPQSLQYLTFGHYFNQKIKENVLPQSLLHLTFGMIFNQELKENVLPQSLLHLTFGNYFDKEIKENV